MLRFYLFFCGLFKLINNFQELLRGIFLQIEPVFNILNSLINLLHEFHLISKVVQFASFWNPFGKFFGENLFNVNHALSLSSSLNSANFWIHSFELEGFFQIISQFFPEYFFIQLLERLLFKHIWHWKESGVKFLPAVLRKIVMMSWCWGKQ